ncbi:MAG TPA: CNNM domain-containing protein, partial [Thermoanaerobaculia bacterium]
MTAFYLILAALFVLANGYFVAAEVAIVKVRSTQLAELSARGSTRARTALRLTRNLDAYLSATQLGITLASLALGWIGEPAFAGLIEPSLERFGQFS